jgi:hypothetical protein
VNSNPTPIITDKNQKNMVSSSLPSIQSLPKIIYSVSMRNIFENSIYSGMKIKQVLRSGCDELEHDMQKLKRNRKLTSTLGLSPKKL